ncbi:polyribonucleotide nucleotidyltransferase [Candidatus Wolfebacteria bacterium]|nr:MAG: polyribonucleotide nucleotidyltransferase [Candidatus Wolfebacteria bacterium]
MQKKEYSIEVNGSPMIAEFSDLAEQASGSVIMRHDDTAVLITAVMNPEPKDGGWFPLTVDYEERFYAAGRILGSRFQRREGRPTDEAILTGRIVDRTIRPLFDQWIRHDIQIVVTVLALGKGDPDTLAVTGASLALATSNIPWNGPVSAIRIGKDTNSEAYLVNPTYTERAEDSHTFDLLACGKDGKINMIEVGSSEAHEDIVSAALARASEEIEKIQTWQTQIIGEIGKEKTSIPKVELSSEVIALFSESITPKLGEAVMSNTPGKESIEELGREWKKLVAEKLPEENVSLASELYEEKVDELLHTEAIENDARADGRDMDTVRPLFAQAGGISTLLHGSGTFYRGGTHILSVLTLGGPNDTQILEGMEIQTKKRYIHHYNFPPYSVGETGRVGGMNRRMIGHGALAEKALEPLLPAVADFPYTIRIVSEALASNGSTSMGSVCGSTLALMDAGVPIVRPVAGIASGLMMERQPFDAAQGNAPRYKVLTDIQGPEDHHGDMDFKVAGTTEGITAIQMDVKVDGIPISILTEALEKAKIARLHILETITTAIASPRTETSIHAPRIVTVLIKPEQIGGIIGSGGKVINDIRERTETDIDIEDDGHVFITGKGEGPEKAKAIIEAMTHEYKAGEKYEGEVVKITDFGAFVKINGAAEGLVHISEIAPFRLATVEGALSEGEKVPVVVLEVDDRDRIKLSIKAADPTFAEKKGLKASAAPPADTRKPHDSRDTRRPRPPHRS